LIESSGTALWREIRDNTAHLTENFGVVNFRVSQAGQDCTVYAGLGKRGGAQS
jgi:hypothetical protein